MKIDIKATLKRFSGKKTVLILSAGLILVAAIGFTVAWLTAQSALMSNSFQKAEITCDIEETFEDNVKSDVRIHNTGSMNAYIRVALVPVWKDGDNIVGTPASLSDCAIDWGDNGWAQGQDGYYYCLAPVQAGDFTPVLINSCTVSPQNENRFELQIAAQAVQALPASVVTEVWGCGVSSDGTLEVL